MGYSVGYFDIFNYGKSVGLWLGKLLENNDGTLLDSYDISRSIYAGVRRSVGRAVGSSIASGLGRDVCGEVESCDFWRNWIISLRCSWFQG